MSHSLRVVENAVVSALPTLPRSTNVTGSIEVPLLAVLVAVDKTNISSTSVQVRCGLIHLHQDLLDVGHSRPLFLFVCR